MDKYYFADTIDDIFDNITGRTCPMCENVECDSNSLLKRHFDTKHFKHSIFYEIDGKQACILPCRKECGLFRRSFQEQKRAHFHCPFCEQMYGRSASFKQHLLKTQGNCCKRSEASSSFLNLNHNKLFVQEVEKHPELYDSSSLSIPDKDAIAQAWASVSDAMNEEENSCIARWKKLKSEYIRYVRACESKKNPPNYYLSQYMKFLRPHVNISEENLTALQPTIEIVTDFDIDELDQITDSNLQSGRLSVEKESYRKHATMKRSFSDSSYSDDELPDGRGCLRRKRSSGFVDAADPDMAFFKSILPDIRNMNHRQKNRFKRITLAVIEDILYGSASMPTPEAPVSLSKLENGSLQ